MLYYFLNTYMQQKGTFTTGQEDSTEIPEELKLRLAYREAAVAVLACYYPDPHLPFLEVIERIQYSPPYKWPLLVSLSNHCFHTFLFGCRLTSTQFVASQICVMLKLLGEPFPGNLIM